VHPQLHGSAKACPLIEKVNADTAVTRDSGLPADDAYLSRLEGLGLIKIEREVAGADFRLLNITMEGLNATSENQPFR
jgi:hypothetical protein